MKILFVSRAYPPVTGGLENQNYELSVWLPKITETKTLANKRGKKFLPFFFVYAFCKILRSIKKYDVLLLGDAVLSPLGWMIKVIFKKPVVCVTHGLDLTYNLGIYKKLWVGFFVKKMDKLVAVGNETIEAGVKRGIPREKFVFIPNGIDADKFIKTHLRKELEDIIGEGLKNKKVILTTGRLAAHKGVDWFSKNVVPLLPENIIYLIAGDGEKKAAIKKVIEENKLEDKIKMLGYVTDEEREVLYNTADVYVKPNIKVEGTMEGFGLVVLEAASCRLPVVAARLEGLKDAIQDGENGFLVEPNDAEGFAQKIKYLLDNDEFKRSFGEKAREYTKDKFTWHKIAKRYVKEIGKVIPD